MDEIPGLKQVLGAMIFGANRPLGIPEMKRCLREVAADTGGDAAPYAKIADKEIRDGLAALAAEIQEQRTGFVLAEVAGGFRYQSDPACGLWIRHLLKLERPQRLSQPALETLAIIAYRQPATKAQIEAVRGVGVDHVVRALMEMQLVKIAGRSELPGRPFLYATTQLFLEHFGLTCLDDLAAGAPGLRDIAEAAERPVAVAEQMEAPLSDDAPEAEDSDACTDEEGDDDDED